MDRQLLLVNTARSLKFLKDYMDHQGQIWKIFHTHQMIPDNIQDLHFYIDDFKNGIEKEFAFLKEATCKNVENFQSSLSLQQTYSTSLCSHVNNIYNKLAESQQQLPHANERSRNLDRSFRNIYIIPSFPTREQHAHSVQNARSRFTKLNQSYSC